MLKKLFAGVVLLALMAAACTPQVEQVRAVLAAREYLRDRLGVDLGAIEVVSFEQREWPDACLGLGEPDEMCAQVVTPGWEIVLRVAGQEHVLRTNADGSVVRREVLSPTVEAAREFLSEALGVDPGAIEVVSFEQREWPDACLGLGEADEMCAQVITPGWWVELRAQGQRYVLRTDEGGRIVRRDS